MTKGDLRVAFFMPVKHLLKPIEGHLWEPGVAPMAACQAPKPLQAYRHRRQASSHRRPNWLSVHRARPIQRFIHQQPRNLNHLRHRQHLLAARAIQMTRHSHIEHCEKVGTQGKSGMLLLFPAL